MQEEKASDVLFLLRGLPILLVVVLEPVEEKTTIPSYHFWSWEEVTLPRSNR